MKKNYILSLTILCALCSLFKAPAQQNKWTQKASYIGGGAAAVASFSIGNKGYFCGGLNNSNVAQKDVWEYNPANNSWTQKADAGTLTRYSATGFSIGSKGYICLGWELLGQHALNDLWEYDAAQNTWSAKSNFPGSARYHAVAFVINNKAYVGLGYAPVKNDFYEYNPSNDTWTLLTNTFPGGARMNARAFSLTYTITGITYKKGYVTGGTLNPNANTLLTNDLWEFSPGSTPGSGTWLAKTNFPGNPRYALFAFALNNKGYVGGGLGTAQTIFNDFYEYDPLTNAWTQRDSFPGNNRISAKTFVIGNKAYVGTGQDLNVYYPEFYEYGPDCIKAYGSTTFCLGGDVLLVATASTSSTYQWKKNGVNINNATSYRYTAKTSGNYNCLITTSGISTLSNSITITVLPHPTSFTVNASGSTSFCAGDSVQFILTPAGNFSYQWFRGSLGILGATNSFYTAYNPGAYKAVVTNNQNGCMRISGSKTVAVTCREMNPSVFSGGINSPSVLNVYPNPAQRSFMIEINDATEINETASLELINYAGQKVFETNSMISNGNLQYQFDADKSIVNGIYTLIITTSQKQFNSKVVIN